MITQPCGLLFVFSGPSGAGKNAIMKAVMKRETDLHQLPTATTRAMRADEQHGREHEFIGEEEFRQRILDKQLIEWQIIHDKGIYGVPRATIQEGIRSGRTLVADVDVLGAMQLKQEFGDHLVLIFIQAPDKATLEKRLRNRSDFSGEEDLLARLRRADFEMDFAGQYDHRIVNSDGALEETVDEALRIIYEECQHPADINGKLGWNPENIDQSVTGLVVDHGRILLYHNTLPEWPIEEGSDLLPFDVVQEELEAQLGIDILPTRPDAIFRKVDVGFEPPQLVHSEQLGERFIKNYIYVLQSVQPLVELPHEWSWASIAELDLDPTLRNLLLEANFILQAD